MSYQVIARKWRPKSFTELVGQPHISQTLLNALNSNRLPHALLFTGPRGTGKTSSARILAKSLRCPNVKKFIPCNECSDCEDIASGRSVDVIEIDGASNNGVDAIRELRDTVGYMPSSGSYKVYIIDEVHMLSGSAFNALLKTLEEPPEHVIFIMATTEVHKIPNTILSRCQRFDFRRISVRLICERLKEICEKENVTVDEEALWLIGRQADGSMRDSQSLLDQVITFCQKNITHEKVVEVLGLTDRHLLAHTLEALVERQPKKVVDVIEQIFTSGYDPIIFVKDLLEELRHLLLVKINPGQCQQIVDLPETEIEKLKELGAPLSNEDVHMLFDMALKGANDLHRSQDPKVVLEMLLLRMAGAPRIHSLLSLPTASAPATTEAPATNPVVATPKATTKIQSPSLSGPQEKWLELVNKIKKVNSVIAAKLEHSYVMEINDKAVTVGIPAKMKFLYDQVSDKNFQRKLTNYMNTFWGPGYKIEIQMGSEEKEKKTSALSPKQLEEQQTKQKKQLVKEEVENHPLVKSTQDVFESEIVSIKEIK